MTADATCPLCQGGGELVKCRGYACSHINDPAYRCHGCNGEGSVPADEIDREGDLIAFTGCNCDMDEPCSDARCQMERDLEQRHMLLLYRRGALTPRRDVQRQMYADVMVDAGRDYLLRDDERGPW